MKYLIKYPAQLVLLEILAIAAILLAKETLFKGGIAITEALILSLIFAINTGVVLAIFFRGRTKTPESHTLHTLVSVSLKFIIELFIVLGWFLILKKTGTTSLLLFFVLYLSFTLFSVFVILRTLKYRSL